MKSAHKNTVFIVLLGITAALIVGSAFLQLRVGVNAAKTSRIDPGKEYGRYVMLIAERIDSPFWQMVYAGALEAAEELDCVVELSGPLSGADRRSTDEYLIMRLPPELTVFSVMSTTMRRRGQISRLPPKREFR